MNIEEIKKEMYEQSKKDCQCGSGGVCEDCIVYYGNIIKILDKYKDKEDKYKTIE